MRQRVLEKNGFMNVLFYEFNDKEKGGAAAGAAWTVMHARYAWSVATATYSGATTIFLG